MAKGVTAYQGTFNSPDGRLGEYRKGYGSADSFAEAVWGKTDKQNSSASSKPTDLHGNFMKNGPFCQFVVGRKSGGFSFDASAGLSAAFALSLPRTLCRLLAKQEGVSEISPCTNPPVKKRAAFRLPVIIYCESSALITA